MRMIGHITGEEHAAVFSDYLYVQGIENQMEREQGNQFAVWVHDEEKIEAAVDHLEKFQANPGRPEYRDAAAQAEAKRKEEAEAEENVARKTIGREQLWPGGGLQMGRFTLTLIIVSVGLTLLSNFGKNREVFGALAITKYEISGAYIQWLKGLPEIRQGQVWRLITPVFIHMSILHILFNMLWLKDLGTMIERHQGLWSMALLFVVLAVTSNLGQHLWSGPNFGGMSGVVYGLLGYIWMKGKFDPYSGLYLHQSTVIMMGIWYVLCLTGFLGNIANAAHTVGLVVGVVWGYASATGLLGQRRG